MLIYSLIELLFSFALFINALLFIPQAIKIFKEKTAKSVSLLTFLGFLIIQFATVLHGVIHHDRILVIGYLLSMLTCGSIVILIARYNLKKPVNILLDISDREILEQLPGHVYWKNRDGVCLGCNTNNWKDFGLQSLAEFEGKTDYDLFSNSEARAIKSNDQEVMRTGQVEKMEEFTTMFGKTSVYLSHKAPLKNKHGEVIGIIGNSLDITHAKQEIMDRLDMLENIIAVMPGNVYWMNTEGIYLGCNDNQAKATGFSREEIIGKRNEEIRGFFIPEFLDEVNRSVMQSGQPIVVEEPARLNDGMEAVFLSNKVPLQNKRGEISGMVGISIDITERKQAEKTLKMAKELAEAANKVKSEFLRNMQHDLRTPFTGILGLAGVLESQEIEPEKKENLAYITQSAKALLDQLNEIFEFVQTESGQLPLLEKEFNIHTVLEDVFNMMLPSAKNKGLDFSVVIDKNFPKHVIGDRVRTQRIFMNLVANSIKFTETGFVKIMASVANKSNDQIIACFLIVDTGVGIPEDKRNIIFERFNRLTSSYSGVYVGKGLGLPIIKQFLDEMGGQSYLDTKVGEGTTFKVLIPYKLPLLQTVELEKAPKIYTAKKIKDIKISPVQPAAFRPRCKILLVEDHPTAGMIAKRILAGLNCDVDIANNGKTAIKLVEQNAYDLVFMDIGLPDMDGYEVAKYIRSHTIQSIAEIPIVALTAHADDENKHASMNAVIIKPLTNEQAEKFLNAFIPERKPK